MTEERIKQYNSDRKEYNRNDMIALIDNNGYEKLIGTINDKSGMKGIHNISELNSLVKNMGGGGGIPKNAESTLKFKTKSGMASPSITFYAVANGISCTVINVTSGKTIFPAATSGEPTPGELNLGINKIGLPAAAEISVTVSDTYNCGFDLFDIDSYDEISLGCTEFNPMIEGVRRINPFWFKKVSFGNKSTFLYNYSEFFSPIYLDCTKYDIDSNNVLAICNVVDVEGYNNGYMKNFKIGSTVNDFSKIILHCGDTSIPSEFTIPSSVVSFGMFECITKKSSTATIGISKLIIGDEQNGSNLSVVDVYFLGDTKGDGSYTYAPMEIVYYGDSVPTIIKDAVPEHPYPNCIIRVKDETIRDAMRNDVGNWQTWFPKIGAGVDNIILLEDDDPRPNA